MDYNIQELDNRINVFRALGEERKRDLLLLYQVRLEYTLVFLLGYFWNKNFSSLEPNSQEYVVSKVGRPSVGDIIDICRKLDIGREVFGDESLRRALNDYPQIRNRYLGHGYSFEDGIDQILSDLKSLNETLSSTNERSTNILAASVDMILVTKSDGDIFSGIRFSGSSMSYSPWTCSRKVCEFKVNNLYANISNYHYHRLSPFLNMELLTHVRTLMFVSIEERLTGRAKYNSTTTSEQTHREWEEFSRLGVEIDGTKRKSPNGTIVNVFTNNYKKYIPLEIKNRVSLFLRSKAFVCATVWGHGGVGKTATIQSICDDLLNSRQREFDYIIFLTAKDRRFNFETGEIEEILFDERVDSLSSIVQKVNQIVFGDSSTKQQNIQRYKGRMLLIIDDFETFPTEEKTKLRNFIKQLDINHHKIVITTRANISLGEEIATNELGEGETLGFLRAVLPIEFGDKVDMDRFMRDFKLPSLNQKRLYEITGGRPLFIFQFAHLYAANHLLDGLLENDIKASVNAVRFLYDRIYEYLSDDAKQLFIILGQLIRSKENLSHLISKAKYVLGWEQEEERFVNCTDELVKLKVIEIDERGIFHIYSREIWESMTAHFELHNGEAKEKWAERLKRVARGSESVEHALLLDADNSRHFSTETEVVTAYHRVLDRANCGMAVRLSAVQNLAEYLFNDLGKKSDGLKLLGEFAKEFADEPTYVKTYAAYLWSSLDIEDIQGSQRNRKNAIKVLNEYFSGNRDFKELQTLELLGMAVNYRTTLQIEILEDLETKRNFLEVAEPVFQVKTQECMDAFVGLFKDGNRLFKSLSSFNFDDGNTTPATKTRIASGLLSFVDVCERIHRFASGEKVCLYVYERFGSPYAEQFFEKAKKLYLSQGKSESLALRVYKNRLAKRKTQLETPKPTREIKVIKLGTIKRNPDGSIERGTSPGR